MLENVKVFEKTCKVCLIILMSKNFVWKEGFLIQLKLVCEPEY